MCLYILYYQSHPHYPIILAGNRDEFYERNASPLHRWTDHTNIIGGKDLKEGGSWLAVNNNGNFAVVTNYRDPANLRDNVVSRGSLVSNFLIQEYKPEEYLNKISESDNDYNGYNLIIGNHRKVYYYSNIIHHYKKLTKGIYMLSNHLLDTPWYKTLRAKRMCSEVIGMMKEIDIDALLRIFTDYTIAPDDQLPDTGIGYKLERMLSSIFIESAVYGTMATTILTIDNEGKVNIHEKTYKPAGQTSACFLSKGK